MKRSRAELAAQLMRAARGAGLPLAVGEDLYSAAGFLVPSDIRDILDDMADGGADLIQLIAVLDDVECGATSTRTGSLAVALAAARGWRLEQGKRVDGAVTPTPGPIDLSDEVWSSLDALSARTYVPETAASRARGAGAGEIDND